MGAYSSGCLDLRYHAHLGQWQLSFEGEDQALVIESDAATPDLIPAQTDACTLQPLALSGDADDGRLCVGVTFHSLPSSDVVSTGASPENLAYCAAPVSSGDTSSTIGFLETTHNGVILSCGVVLAAALLVKTMRQRLGELSGSSV